jgi:hypothetical protein
MEIFWSWLPFTSLLPHYAYNHARNYLIIAIFLLLILTSLAIWKMHNNNAKIIDIPRELLFAGLMIIFSIAYIFVLAFSYIYTIPTPDLITRTFLPAHIALLLGFFALCLFFIRAWPALKWLPLLPILIAVGISISYLHDSLDIVLQYHQFGSGYTSRAVRNSETIRALEQLPSNIPLISNESALVLFYNDHPAYDISELTNDAPLKRFTRYGDDPTDPAQIAFRENGAALVLFNSSFWQFKRLYGDQTSKRMEDFIQGLDLFAQLEDGAIYFYNATGK